MMTFEFRMTLIIGAVIALWFMLHNIRKSKMMIGESIFWLFFAVLLVLLALKPEIAYWLSHQLGIISPSNLVFLIIIGLLVIRVFQQDVKLSVLTTKVKNLTQNLAIYEADHGEPDGAEAKKK